MNYANKGFNYSRQNPELCHSGCKELGTERINHGSHKRHWCIPACWWLCLNIYISHTEGKKGRRKPTLFHRTTENLLPTRNHFVQTFNNQKLSRNQKYNLTTFLKTRSSVKLHICTGRGSLPAWLFSDWAISAAMAEFGFSLLPYMWDGGRLREDPGRVFACKKPIRTWILFS